MGHGIERRLKGDLFSFTFVDPEHYEDLGRYDPGGDSFRPLVEPHLRDGWQLFKSEIWFHALPDSTSTPEQGFKIHLAATSGTAAEVLQRAAPVCIDSGTAFKFVCDPRLVDLLNSKTCSRASSGKFLTLYPKDDADCARLLEALSGATAGLAGPYLLSDRPYKESRTVYYRYGGFLQRFQVNLFGEKLPLLRAADGRLIPDARTPFFQVPPGIEDPFFGGAPETSGRICLKERYSVRKALRFSNSGGVYAGTDDLTGQEVVIKEARPFVNLTRGGRCDAVRTLEKESFVLQRMQDTPYVPRFFDFFREWEHAFLVEEFLPGTPLSSFRALEEFGLLVQRPATHESVHAFCRRFAKLALHLLDAVETFHGRGVLLGDLSPSNILVDPDTFAVQLIDFEGAFLAELESDRLGSTVTTGFVSPRRRRGEAPAESDDLYSLGSVLFSVILPVQECFALDESASQRFLTDVIDHYGLPVEVENAICAFLEGDAARGRAALESLAARPLSSWRPGLQAPASVTADTVRETIAGIRYYILSATDLERRDRLWPSDYRIFNTNPLSLAYGALGTCLFLHRTGGGLDAGIRRWVLDQPVSRERQPPGLFVGLGGIAWGLHEIGETERSLAVLDEAWSSPLIREGPDLFFGTAGLGLASLFVYGQTGEERLLRRTCEAADLVLAAAQSDKDGLFWLNADGQHYYGYAHGGSGIALFLLRAYQATGDDRYRKTAEAALELEISRGIYRDGYAVWPRSAADPLRSPYWRYGAAGIGAVLLRFWQVLRDDRYLRLAEQAGRYVAVRHTVQSGQLTGLAGMGELLLDLHRITGDPLSFACAEKLIEGILLFRITRTKGYVFPGEELMRLTTDYGTGSAGVGLLLTRVLDPQDRLFFDFPLGR